MLVKVKRHKRNGKWVSEFTKTTRDTDISIFKLIFGRTGSFILACTLIVVLTSIVIEPKLVKAVADHVSNQLRRQSVEMTAPVELLNPFIGVESAHAETMPLNSNSIQAEEMEDTRYQDCKAQGGDPLVMKGGFTCALPAK